MTLLRRHSTARGTPPAPLPEMVFHGLAPDENAQMQGVVFGTGELVAARTSSIYTPDMDGVDREFIDVQPGISGARTDLDPVKYAYMCIVSAQTTSLTMRVHYNPSTGRSSRYKYVEPGGDVHFTEKVGTNVSATWLPPVGTEAHWYLGDASSAWTVYLANNTEGDMAQWFTVDAFSVNITTNRFTGGPISLAAMASKASSLVAIQSSQYTGAMPDLSQCSALTTFDAYSSAWGSVAEDFAWPASANVNVLRINGSHIASSADINRVLIAADAAVSDGSGLSISLNGGTNSAPTGAGITAKDNLITKGATVTTN